MKKRLLFFLGLAATVGIVASSSEFKWVKSAYSIVSASTTGIESSTDGKIYVTGAFRDSLCFDGSNYTYANNTAANSGYVACYDTTGAYKWVLPFKGATASKAVAINAIAKDSKGNLYVTGQFASSMQVGSMLVKDSTSSAAFFLAKVDNTGNLIWINTQHADTTIATIAGKKLAIDADNNIYVAGSVSRDSVKFGGFTINTNFPVTSNRQVGFLAKYKDDGTVVWAKNIILSAKAVSPANTYVNYLKTDNSGNLMIAGYVGANDTCLIGSEMKDTLIVNGFGAKVSTFYLAKLDNTGKLLWKKSVYRDKNSLSATPVALEIDENNNAYLAGNYSFKLNLDNAANQFTSYGSAAWLAKWDTNGSLLWAKDFQAGVAQDSLGATGSARALALSVKNNVISFVGSYTRGLLYDSSLASNTVTNNFIALLDANGNTKNLTPLTSSTTVSCNNAIFGADERLYVSGTYRRPVFFPGITDSLAYKGDLTKTSVTNTFIAAIKPELGAKTLVQTLDTAMTRPVVSAPSATISFKTSSYDGTYAPAICLAVWVTDTAGNYVRTLNYQGNRYAKYLIYNALDLSKDSTTVKTDGVSGESLLYHNMAYAYPYTKISRMPLVWDCKNQKGDTVPNGKYYINIEFTEVNGGGKYIQFEFNKGEVSTVYTRAEETTDPGMYFSNLRVAYTALNTTATKTVYNDNFDILVYSLDRNSLVVQSENNNVLIEKVQLFDVRGLSIVEQSVSDIKANINTNGLKGIYIIRVTDSNGDITSRKVFIGK